MKTKEELGSFLTTLLQDTDDDLVLYTLLMFIGGSFQQTVLSNLGQSHSAIQNLNNLSNEVIAKVVDHMTATERELFRFGLEILTQPASVPTSEVPITAFTVSSEKN